MPNTTYFPQGVAYQYPMQPQGYPGYMQNMQGMTNVPGMAAPNMLNMPNMQGMQNMQPQMMAARPQAMAAGRPQRRVKAAAGNAPSMGPGGMTGAMKQGQAGKHAKAQGGAGDEEPQAGGMPRVWRGGDVFSTNDVLKGMQGYKKAGGAGRGLAKGKAPKKDAAEGDAENVITVAPAEAAGRETARTQQAEAGHEGRAAHDAQITVRLSDGTEFRFTGSFTLQ